MQIDTWHVQCEIRKKSVKFELESGIALKKRDFPPESGNVDTYDIDTCCQ